MSPGSETSCATQRGLQKAAIVSDAPWLHIRGCGLPSVQQSFLYLECSTNERDSEQSLGPGRLSLCSPSAVLHRTCTVLWWCLCPINSNAVENKGIAEAERVRLADSRWLGWVRYLAGFLGWHDGSDGWIPQLETRFPVLTAAVTLGHLRSWESIWCE
jgi:hypothetical protein